MAIPNLKEETGGEVCVVHIISDRSNRVQTASRYSIFYSLTQGSS